MKRVMFALMLLALAFATSTQATIGIGILSAGYTSGGQTAFGYGLEIEAPLLPIPLAKTCLEVTYLPASGYSLMPILLTGRYSLPALPIYLGAGAGAVIYNQPTAGFSAPTVINYNAFVGYENSLMPMSSYFIQAGYEVMKIDYAVAGTSFSRDFTGVSVKAGLRFGI